MASNTANVRTSAGSTVDVSADLPASYIEADYELVTPWGYVGLISNVGEYGRTYQDVTFNPLDTRGTIHRKGTFDEGQLPLQCAYDPSDAGQTVLKAAALTDDLISIRITLQSGEIQYYTGQVFSATVAVNDANSITMGNYTIQLESGSGVTTPAP